MTLVYVVVANNSVSVYCLWPLLRIGSTLLIMLNSTSAGLCSPLQLALTILSTPAVLVF